MDTSYKLHLVKTLPHQESKRNNRPAVGGFGLTEDDLIYQMVINNLTEEVHSIRNHLPSNRKSG